MGLRQGGIELTAMQEAVLDLAVEQALSPALTLVNGTFVQVMLEHGIPLEAIVTELVLSGEVERTNRLVRESGYAAQFEFHSPTSQYGQLVRRDEYDGAEIGSTMRRLVDDIASGRFADEWDAEAEAGYPTLERLREQHAGEAVRAFETRSANSSAKAPSPPDPAGFRGASPSSGATVRRPETSGYSGRWQTASTLLPSGSRTNAP